jgi:ubiquitin-protein ligase
MSAYASATTLETKGQPLRCGKKVVARKKRKSDQFEEAGGPAAEKNSRETLSKIGDELKRCKISRSAGELRLRRDVAEVQEKIKSGHVEAHLHPNNPLRFSFTIHRVWHDAPGKVTKIRFQCKAPRRYPFEPPMVTLEQRLTVPHDSTITVDEEDGVVRMPMLEKGKWAPVYTLYDIIVHLAAALHAPQGADGGHRAGAESMDIDQTEGEARPPQFFGDRVDVSHIPPLPYSKPLTM